MQLVEALHKLRSQDQFPMALGLTQSLRETSTSNISSGVCIGTTTLPPSCADCLKNWEPQPPGTLRDCPGM